MLRTPAHGALCPRFASCPSAIYVHSLAFTCTFTDVYIEAPYEITVVDVDLAANDMAGTGACDGKCTLGLAEVEVK